MSTPFNHSTTLYRCYHICRLDGGETVSDHDGCPALPGLVQSILHNLLTLCVQGRGGLIQEEDFGVPYQSTGNGNALLLTSRQLTTSLPNMCVITIRKLYDEIVSIGILSSCNDFFQGGSFSAQADILSNGGVEQNWLLTHNANVGTQPLQIQGFYITSIESDLQAGKKSPGFHTI